RPLGGGSDRQVDPGRAAGRERVPRVDGPAPVTARPDDADRLLGQRCRGQAKATIAGKAFAISVFFQYLELRHQVEIHALTGEIVQCPIDEMNRPRDDWSLNVRIP